MDIVNLKVEELIPYINNPRNNDDAIDKVAASIKEFGFKVPIVIDNNNVVVTGHTRLLASKKLGLQEVPCVVADDLSPAQIKAFRIADNKVSEYAQWKDDMLKVELEELEEMDFDLDSVNIDYSDFDIALDLEDIQEDAYNEDDDIIEEAPKIPYSKEQDIWLLGKHRLMCGDSTKQEDVEKLMDGEKADLVVTDPPYNVAVNNEDIESLKARNRRLDGLIIQNDKMTASEFPIFLEKIFARYYETMKEGASIYVFYADSETINFMTKFTEAGFHFAQNCIWNKQQFVMTRKDYHYKHEPCLYGWKLGKAHNWYTDRKQSSVWDFDRPFKNELHPTMKPIDLIKYPIGNSSKKGDVVLDLFGGSGLTLIASDTLSRKSYLMELDPRYVDVIVKRYINHKDNDGEDVYLLRNGSIIPFNEIQSEFNS